MRGWRRRSRPLALVPSFARGMALAPLADLMLIAGLLALARVALALAGMDVGTAFGGLGAAREMSFAALAEPALILCVLTLAILAGTTNLDAIAATLRDGQLGLRVSLGLALIAHAGGGGGGECPHPGGQPGDASGTDHGARGDDAGEPRGRHLALWEAQAALRLTLWLALIAAIFVPFGAAPAGSGPLAWLVGLVAWVAEDGACSALALAALRERDRQDAGVPRAGVPRRRAAAGPAGRGAALRLDGAGVMTGATRRRAEAASRERRA